MFSGFQIVYIQFISFVETLIQHNHSGAYAKRHRYSPAAPRGRGPCTLQEVVSLESLGHKHNANVHAAESKSPGDGLKTKHAWPCPRVTRRVCAGTLDGPITSCLRANTTAHCSKLSSVRFRTWRQRSLNEHSLDCDGGQARPTRIGSSFELAHASSVKGFLNIWA